MISMLFLCNYTSFSGGHLKYMDHIRHVAGSGLVRPRLYLSEPSQAIESNPYRALGVPIVKRIEPADAYYTSVRMWRWLDKAGIDTATRPVVNLLQGLDLTDPNDPRFSELETRPALRFCVSREIKQALAATGRVQGSLVAVPNGIDLVHLAGLRRSPQARRVLVGGWKQPELALALAGLLQDHFSVDLIEKRMDRQAFLCRLAQAEVAVFLPCIREGFFLPALEAMALGVAVVVPDCVGNRSFCHHEETCLMPDSSPQALASAVERLIKNPAMADSLRSAALVQAQEYSLEREREQVVTALAAYLAGFDYR